METVYKDVSFAGPDGVGAVLCPNGKRVLGGGVWTAIGSYIGDVTTTAPNATNTGWVAGVHSEQPGGGGAFRVFAICTAVST